MTRPFFLSPEQRDEFEHRGVLRLGGLLPPDVVRAARERVVRQLAKIGVSEAGGWRLADGSRPQWPNTGLKTSRVVGNKHPEVQALIEQPALRAVVDELLDGRPVDRTIHRQPQVLFTLPNAETWAPPDGWHVDGPRLASGQGHGVQLFAFLDSVAPAGGGTLVVAGSHRLLNEGRAIRMREMKRLLIGADFFRRLYSPSAEERGSVLRQAGVVGGVEVKVVELTGEAGDAYLTDLRVLHSGAPNAARRPRIMVTHRFVRADLLEELAEAYGWR
jgi:hypothetical protein